MTNHSLIARAPLSRQRTESKLASPPAALLSLRFVRDYIVTMRPYLLFVSGITGIAGLALVVDVAPGSAALLGLAFFFSYGFGQALTDCFQLDTDSLSAPYRPLVQGAIRRRDVLVVSLAGLFGIGLLLASFSLLTLPLAALAVAGLVTYTYFKRRWWAGPFYNAWIVALLALIAYVAAAGAGAAGEAPGAVLMSVRSTPMIGTIVCAFFAYANFVLTGYYKDISADRATGYRTLPVVFGMRFASHVSDVFAVMAVGGFGVAFYSALSGQVLRPGHDLALALGAAGVVASLVAQLRLRHVRREADAHQAISPVVHAHILLLAAIAASQKPAWSEALCLLYIAFVIAMELRPMRQQI